MPATYDDANLIMQIVRWGTEMGVTDAVRAMHAESFDPENVGADDPNVGKVLGFGEVIGTFVKNGVLNRGLVLDLWWMEGFWALVGPAARKQRERMGEPRLFENFEALVEGA